MLKNEFVENIAIGDKLISVGLDDYGQSYFLEWAEDGVVHTASCGTYNTDYKTDVEYLFGIPSKNCELYKTAAETPTVQCAQRGKYGYCDKCEFCDVKWTAWMKLVDMNIIDRRGNILEPYSDLLERKVTNENS